MKRHEKSPPAGTGGASNNHSLAANNLENTFNPCNLQAFRAAYLTRRHRLAPAFAAAVAGLAFTVEATK